MPFIPAPARTIRIAYEQVLAGQEVLNVMHAVRDPAVVFNAALADAAFNAWKARFCAATANFGLSSSIVLNRVVLTDVQLQNGAQVTSTVAAAAGYATQIPLASEIATCCTLRTGFSGRSFRGRLYLAGIPYTYASSTDNNRLSSAKQTDAQASVAGLISDLAAAGLLPVVASYRTNKLPRSMAAMTTITSVSVNSRFDSQRRRMPRN